MTKTEIRRLTKLSNDFSKPDELRTLAATAVWAAKKIESLRGELTDTRNRLSHTLQALEIAEQQANQPKEQSNA